MADFGATSPLPALTLTFLRRPAISLGAGAAHQHSPLGVAQAISHAERLDGLLVVDDGERARPVRAPQAAIETPGIEHAGEPERGKLRLKGVWERSSNGLGVLLSLDVCGLRLKPQARCSGLGNR